MKRTQIMAHDISVPIRYECRIAQASFARGQGRLVGWERLNLVGALVLKAIAQADGDIRPKRAQFVHGYFDPGDLPKEITAPLPPTPVGARDPQPEVDIPFEAIIASFSHGPLRERRFDQWVIRGAFLEMEPDGVVAFLNRFGAWNAMSEPSPKLGFATDGAAGAFGWKSVIIAVGQVLSARAAIVEALPKGPKHWFEHFASPAEFASRGEFPHYIHVDRNCESAIKTSITADFLRGVKFGICARPDCRRPFARERKGKIYCQQYCAHLESVRRSRNTQDE